MTEQMKLRWEKRKRIGRIVVLAASAYALVTTLVLLFFPDAPGILLYIAPYGLMYVFLSLWFNPAWLILGLSLLPLAGWLLLRSKGGKLGKTLVILPQVALLVLNFFVTPFHFLIGAGSWSMDKVHYTALLFIAGAAVPVVTLWGLTRWYPKVKF